MSGTSPPCVCVRGPKTFARLNGGEVVTLAVRKRAGENLVRIADEVKAIIRTPAARAPPGVSLVISNDQSILISRRVNELENSIMTGMFLVVIMLFMFFGLKNSLLISTSIPLSLFIGFIILAFSGITLNMVVLFALVLVLGIVVDDAIVVIENIYRHQQAYDKTPVQAAKDATAEVAVPVATSTFTTLAAFIPLLFWPGVVGDFMKYLPLTLIFTMGGSLFVAYVISPVQGAQWIDYRKEIRKTRENLVRPHWYKRYNPFTIVYHKVDEKFFPWMQGEYGRTLEWTLSRAQMSLPLGLKMSRKAFTILASVAFLILVFILFGLFNKGVVFFPETQPALVNVRIEAPPGTSLDVTDGITAIVEDALTGLPAYGDMEFVVTSVGSSDNPFDFGGQGTPNKGSVALNFYEKAKRSQSTRSRWTRRGRGSRDPRRGVEGQPALMGPPVGAPISVEISGDEYAQLAALSAKAQAMIKDIPGLVDLKDNFNAGKPEIEVVIDRENAALAYMTTAQIAGAVRAAISGIEASKYRVGEDEYKIRVRLREDQRSSPADLENLYITFMNKQGKLLSVPLVSVATIRRTGTISDIQRKDQKRVLTLTADVQGRLASEVLADVKTTLAGLQLPVGLRHQVHGRGRGAGEGRGVPLTRVRHHAPAGLPRAGHGVQLDPRAVRDHALRDPLVHRRADRAPHHAHPVQRHHDGGGRHIACRHRREKRDRAAGLHQAPARRRDDRG